MTNFGIFQMSRFLIYSGQYTQKIVSVLCRRFGFDQIEIAEDIANVPLLIASKTVYLQCCFGTIHDETEIQ